MRKEVAGVGEANIKELKGVAVEKEVGRREE